MSKLIHQVILNTLQLQLFYDIMTKFKFLMILTFLLSQIDKEYYTELR